MRTRAASSRVRVVGYVRVSTEQQKSEGISIEVQKQRIAAHCQAQGLQLVQIQADEGASAKSLERPGLQRALQLLRNGMADALMVLKLDRLTRSVKDLGYLCEAYFGEDKRWSLLSVSDAIDTRSACGKLMLNVLTSVAQWEREALRDRTREAMQHLKSQGVVLGAAPFGWMYKSERDAYGRRTLAQNPVEQAAIQLVCALFGSGLSPGLICAQLNAQGVPCRGSAWHRRSVDRVLQRAGRLAPAARPRRLGPPLNPPAHRSFVRDQAAAAKRAAAHRGDGRSLRWIADRLVTEGLLPPRGDVWHAASVLDLLRRHQGALSAP